jgi:signal transduction histidine kinase
MKECSLCEIISRCVSEMKPLATQKKLDLRTELSPNLCLIYGSTTRLQQVLTNLVSNSINYTPEGEVLVRATELDQGVCVEVIDTGIGIPAQDVPNIFIDFFRGSNVTTKGTGLGLSIAKRIVEAHNGRIYCESPCVETGKGTRFSFVLPKAQKVGGRQSG